MKNTIHTDNQYKLTYEKGVNGDIHPSKKYETEGTAFRLINARINPLTKMIESIDGVDPDMPIPVIRDGVIPWTLGGQLIKSITVGDFQVLLMGGPFEAQIAIYDGAQIRIVAQNLALGWREGYKIDMSTDGKDEIYICGPQTPNLFLSISDMLTSVSTEKYFIEFDLNKHISRVGAAMGVPIYISHENVGSALGLKAGAYVYFIRLVDADGNRTPWSQSTPLIPVAYKVGSRTVGAPPSSNTSQGVRIRFRLDGTAGYSYVEIGRMAYNAGQPIGFLPNMEVTKLVNDAYGTNVVLNSVAQVIDFIDINTHQYVVDTTEYDVSPSQMDHCNNVVYYDGRVIYSGVKYKQLDLSPNITVLPTQNSTIYPTHTPNTYTFPITESIGTDGHTNIWNQVYRKCLTPGDYKSYAIVLFDGKGGRTPALKVAALQSLRTPNIREPLIPESNIISKRTEQHVLTSNQKDITLDPFQATDGDALTIGTDKITWSDVRASDKQFTPLRPHSLGDPIVTNYRLNKTSNAPKILNREYRTIGQCINGIDPSTLPDWVEAFSIVASDDLGIVVASGIGTYSLRGASNISLLDSRDTKGLWIYSDMFSINPDLMQDIKNNPSQYSVQLVAPVSFSEEVAASFTGLFDGSIERPYSDLICHTGYKGWLGGDVLFGQMDGVVSPIQPSTDYANAFKYSIVSATVGAGAHQYATGDYPYGTPFLRVVLNADIYNAPSYSNSPDNTLEPYYMVNIVREANVNVISSNISTYKAIGHYQKLKSVIGVGTGAAVEFKLVDERPDDCFPLYDFPVFVYVDDEAWACFSSLSDDQLTTLNNTGHVTVDGVSVYGVYTPYTIGSDHIIRFSNNLNAYNNSITIPKQGAVVSVRYNSKAPIKIFPGNNYVGISNFVPIDIKLALTGAYNNQLNTFQIYNASWQARYIHDQTYDKADNINYNSLGHRRVNKDAPASYYAPAYQSTVTELRQWLIRFNSISPVNTPLIHGGYSAINYIDTLGYGWIAQLSLASSEGADKDISKFVTPDYTSVYGSSIFDRLAMGGFMLPKYNLDYMRVLSGVFTSLPARGFTEVTDFPNRVIWSNRRQESVQDVPSNKTFSALSVYDLPSNSGDNTYITANSNILTVFTERDIAIIPINRYTLSNVDGSNMGLLQTNRFIGEVTWLNAGIGIPKGKTAQVCTFLGSTLFISKDNEAFILTDKLNQISTGFRWRLDSLSDNEVIGVGLGIYNKSLGEVWIPASTGFIVYSMTYQSWYNVLMDTSKGFFLHPNMTLVRTGKACTMNGVKNFAGSLVLSKAHFIAQPIPTAFKEFVYMEMYGTNVLEAEIRAPKINVNDPVADDFSAVVGITREYRDVFKDRGTHKWCYFPSNENHPFNRCQGDWVAISFKGYPNTESLDKFRINTVEIGTKKIV